MEIEQGITTQRFRLLRLIAGLLMVVAFVSSAPFSSHFRRWVRDYVLSILTRAETAARALVIAQAAVHAGQRGLRFDVAQVLGRVEKPCPDAALADVPSLAALRQRLMALRALLKNLPRQGLRLLRRVLDKSPETRGSDTVFHRHQSLRAWRLIASPIERPPIRKSVMSVAVN